MKRRNFIKASAGTALTLSSWSLLTGIEDAAAGPVHRPALFTPELNIRDDGSFDIYLDDLEITGCYPSLDGAYAFLDFYMEVRAPITSCVYRTPAGKVILNFIRRENALVLQAGLEDFTELPHWFFPLSGGLIRGSDRFFKQGLGFAGPSGIFPFPEPEKRMERDRLKEGVWSYDSYLTSGLLDPAGNTLAWTAMEHNRFMNRTTFYNRQHRYGLIDRHLDDEKLLVETGFSVEKMKTNERVLSMPELLFTAGPRSYDVFSALARLLAERNRARTHMAPRYYYCSWYEFGKNFSFRHLGNLLDGLKTIRPPLDIQAVQIDDGYCYRGDWLESNERWPGGMPAAFKAIQDAGLQPGIWVAPFMVSSKSSLFREHPDWLLREKEGNIIVEWRDGDEDTMVLDSSHPEAFNYLRTVFATLRRWGARVYKTDFMDWGLRDSQKVKRHSPGKTSVEYFNDVVSMIREEIGDDSYWLGCIAPYPQMIGYVDGMRVSNDVHPSWSRESTLNMFREMFVGQYFNNVLWQNDPDVLYLRDQDSELNRTEKLAIAYWDGIMGGVVNTSDRFHTLDEEAIRLWRFLKPSDDKGKAVLPFWEDHSAPLVALRFYEKDAACGVLVLNYSDEEKQAQYKLSSLTGKFEQHIYNWNQLGTEYLGFGDQLELTLLPRSARLFYLNTRKSPPPPGLTIGGKINEALI